MVLCQNAVLHRRLDLDEWALPPADFFRGRHSAAKRQAKFQIPNSRKRDANEFPGAKPSPAPKKLTHSSTALPRAATKTDFSVSSVRLEPQHGEAGGPP